MLQQVTAVKISAQNIKTTLVSNNKKLLKLKKDQMSFDRNIRQQETKRQKEETLEAKGSPNMVQNIGSSILAGPMSLFDKIKEFFGTVLLGILVNNLPLIYSKIQKFLDDNKDVIETIKTIVGTLGNVLFELVKLVQSINLSKFKKDVDNMIKEVGDVINIANSLVADTVTLKKDLKDEFKDTFIEKTPEQVVEDVKQELPKSGLDQRSFRRSLGTYRSAKSSSEPTQKIKIPGLGSYQKTRGFLGFGTSEKATDVSGAQITAEEFDKRFLNVIEKQDEIYSQMKSQGVKGYSQGGTVKPQTSGRSGGESFSGESASARKARESTQSFTDFESSTYTTSNIIEIQKENNKSFEKLIENFRNLALMSKDDGKPSGQPPSGQPPAPTPGAKGPIITFDSAQGADPGQPGVDFSYADIYSNYSIFPGTVVEVGSYYGSGYGRHVTVRSKDTNGKEFDALYAHFGNFAVKVGDTVQAGTYLGSVGWDIKKDRAMPGAGNMTGPHTSVDFYERNSYPGHTTGKYSGADRLIQLILRSANKDVRTLNLLAPPKPKVTPKSKNGGQKMGLLVQSFDNVGSDGEVLVVMAQQPIIVPGPTRYITRTRTQVMPVAVPIAPKSSGLRELV